jgi:hypothetical protein
MVAKAGSEFPRFPVFNIHKYLIIKSILILEGEVHQKSPETPQAGWLVCLLLPPFLNIPPVGRFSHRLNTTNLLPRFLSAFTWNSISDDKM